jgi:hypothetical protein
MKNNIRSKSDYSSIGIIYGKGNKIVKKNKTCKKKRCKGSKKRKPYKVIKFSSLLK